MFQPLFQALVAEGVAVFAPNVRGSGGYGRSFAPADDHERRFAAITDVRAAVEFLVVAGLADAARIGVSGRSYGGYLTLAALAWYPELFAVGVDVCGISDFATFYAQTEPWIAAAATSKYGDPDADAGAAARAVADPPRRPDHRAAARGARRARHQRADRRGRAGGGRAARARGAPRGSCCSPTRATRCAAPRTGPCSCARSCAG